MIIDPGEDNEFLPACLADKNNRFAYSQRVVYGNLFPPCVGVIMRSISCVSATAGAVLCLVGNRNVYREIPHQIRQNQEIFCESFFLLIQLYLKRVCRNDRSDAIIGRTAGINCINGNPLNSRK